MLPRNARDVPRRSARLGITPRLHAGSVRIRSTVGLRVEIGNRESRFEVAVEFPEEGCGANTIRPRPVRRPERQKPLRRGPLDPGIDIGPVIDEEAAKKIRETTLRRLRHERRRQQGLPGSVRGAEGVRGEHDAMRLRAGVVRKSHTADLPAATVIDPCDLPSAAAAERVDFAPAPRWLPRRSRNDLPGAPHSAISPPRSAHWWSRTIA